MENDERLLAFLTPRACDFLTEDMIIPNITVQNICVTFKLGAPVNQIRITSHYLCARFCPDNFGAVIIQFQPKVAALVFAQGACNCVGASSFERAYFACQILRLMLQRITPEHYLRLQKLHFRNTVMACRVDFHLALEKLQEARLPGDTVTYVPESFPNAMYHIHEFPRITAVIAESGCINFVGQQSFHDTVTAFSRLRKVLENIRTGHLPLQRDRSLLRIQKEKSRRPDLSLDTMFHAELMITRLLREHTRENLNKF